jgi:hypothetical protein
MFTSWQLQQEMCMSECMIGACSAQVNDCEPVHGLLDDNKSQATARMPKPVIFARYL